MVEFSFLGLVFGTELFFLYFVRLSLHSRWSWILTRSITPDQSTFPE
jgi:hypothetical protein